MSWTRKLMGGKPMIKLTAEWATTRYQVDSACEEMVFKQNKADVMGVAFAGSLFISAPVLLFDPPFMYLFAPMFIISMIAAYYFLKRSWYIRKDVIEMNTDWISIKGQKYQWNNILDTYITRRPVGKTMERRLVILLDSEEMVEYQIDKYQHWKEVGAELSTYIEYFKMKHITTPGV